VIEGYRGDVAAGVHAIFEDPLQFQQASATIGYSPGQGVPDDERLHVNLEYKTLKWRLRYWHNGADFYDLFGPTYRSRRGDAVLVGYKNTLIYDPPRQLDFTVDVAGFRGLDSLPRVEAWVDAQPAASWRPLERVRLGPAVADPGAIYTVGLNYDGPGAAPRPERPLIYGKAAGSVAGHGATLAWDRSVTDDVDAEIELGVVIGEGGSVFGYTCVNDVTALDLITADPAFPQWTRAKSFDTFGAFGPWITTGVDPSQLTVRTLLNGRERQKYPVSDMVFSPRQIVSRISRELTLEPGDLIACGTSLGAGVLRPGQTVEVAIDGVGALRNQLG